MPSLWLTSSWHFFALCSFSLHGCLNIIKNLCHEYVLVTLSVTCLQEESIEKGIWGLGNSALNPGSAMSLVCHFIFPALGSLPGKQADDDAFCLTGPECWQSKVLTTPGTSRALRNWHLETGQPGNRRTWPFSALDHRSCWHWTRDFALQVPGSHKF